MNKYQACKELKHRVYVLARTAKRVPNRANSKDADLFLSIAIFLYSRRILFLKKINGLVPNQDPAYKAAIGGTSGSAMAGPFFWPKMVFAGPLFC